MKRNLHTLLCFCALVLIIPGLGMAQMQIPNANFENWVDMENEDDSLVNWSSTSLMVPPYVVLAKNESAYQGDYAVNINTNPVGFTGASAVGILVNGEATFDFQNQMYYVQGGGTPISFQPTHLKGYYKFETTDPIGDQAFARVVLTRYNILLNQRDTVSEATMNFAETDFYTEFAIVLPELLPGVEPDSITTIFYSSNPETVSQFGTQSTLTLDSLHLTNDPVGLTEFHHNSLTVFPNPASGVVTVKSSSVVGGIELYNEKGKRVKTFPGISGGKSQRMDISDLPAGMYYLVSGEESHAVTKLVVQ